MTEVDPPRIDPVRRSEATGEQLAVLEPLGPMGELNIFSTLAVHPHDVIGVRARDICGRGARTRRRWGA